MTEGTAARIRVLPGSALSLPAPPPPPSQPPPQPVHLCKIAVLGDTSSGKSSLVDKFLLRKSISANHYPNPDGSSSSVHWCNASATSNGTFGSALGASLGPSSVEPTLAEYYKKDISLKRSRKNNERNNNQQQHDDDETTCVRAQVWDINVPQSAIISNQRGSNQNNSNSPEYISSSNSVNSTSSLMSSSPTMTQPQDYYNNNNDNLASLAPLLPLLKRINGIIIACQCPSPPSTTTTILPSSSNASHTSYNSQTSHNNRRSNGVDNKTHHVEWAELDLLERQIANWINFIKSISSINGGANTSSSNSDSSSNNNNNNGSSTTNSSNGNTSQYPYNIFVILTFADLAITEYSPKEWMKVSVKMEEICAKFGIHSWRMGTCVSSSSGSGSSSNNSVSNDNNNNISSSSSNSSGVEKGDREAENNNVISTQQRLFQRMARQQQQIMEEMEDGVEASFIDLILLHLDDSIKRR